MTELLNAKSDDPGDDVQRRFRYQHSYGLILLGGMLRKEHDYLSIWCEHHEDFLGQIDDKTFDAIQIKSREDHLGYWKISDAGLASSILRFARLEKEYSTQIRKFVFVSNCALYDTTSPTLVQHSLVHLLAEAKNATNGRPISSWAKEKLGEFCKESECDETTLLRALAKFSFQLGPALSGLDSTLSQLHVSRLPGCEQFTANQLAATRDAMVSIVYRASACQVEDPRVHFHVLSGKGEDPKVAAKRLSTIEISMLIEEARHPSFKYLPNLSSLKLGNAADRISILERKLQAAGLVNHTDSLQRQALTAEGILLSRIGDSEVADPKAMLSQLESVVLEEASAAELEACKDKPIYGVAMLSKLRERLELRARMTPRDVYQQQTAMLLGIAGLLTTDCKIWWGKRFDL